MNQIQEFALIQDFLSLFEPGFDPRVEIRDGDSAGQAALSDAHRKLLDRIAHGLASDADRDQALEVLRRDATALAYLAQQLNQESR